MAGAHASVREAIRRKTAEVERALFEHLTRGGRLAVVQAPPGSGKTRLLLRAVEHASRHRARIAVAAQTNSQADDICRRLAREYPHLRAIRFASRDADPQPLGASITWQSDTKFLPAGPCVVVGTTAKWGIVDIHEPFDVLFVEEAWQMSWSSFMLLGQVAGRFVMIGDPGQIPPVVTIDVSRWETSPRPPHAPAPEVILRDGRIDVLQLSLPATHRLPCDSVDLVRPFYDFDFHAWAAPNERAVVTARGGRERIDAAIDLLESGTIAAVTLPTPAGGPPLERDDELAGLAVRVVARLLERGARIRIDEETRPLEPRDIGLAATHRIMNAAMELALPDQYRNHVRVDTPERWQGLERKVMIVVHPLSGVVRPSAFDLETGRLCVMASRHRAALVVVTRDHVGDTLGRYIPSADQPVGKPDATGRGHARHLGFWETLERQDRVIAA